jgi:hypothetical protein
MSGDLRGAIIAPTKEMAQHALDQMAGMLGVGEQPPKAKDWLVLTPGNWTTAGRGYRLPNRVLVADYELPDVPEPVWQALIPMMAWRSGGEPIMTYFWKRRVNDQLVVSVNDHVFTVRRQDGIGPHPATLGCVLCGLRADQTVRIAAG